MAWTTPRNWSAGETVTASMLNTHLRDNLNFLYSQISGLVKGGAWANAVGIPNPDATIVWRCDRPTTLTSIHALRKGGTGATVNARIVRPAAAVGKFFQVDGSAGPAYVDETTDANSAAAGDVTVFPASEDTSDYCLIGFASKFRAIRYVIATAGVGSGLTATWEYWNGSTWASIASVATLTDGGVGFTSVAGTYETSWSGAGLTNWAESAINGTTLFWVRLKIAAGSYSTNPVLTQVWIIEGADHLSADLSLTTAGEWIDGGTPLNTSYIVGDSLELVLRSVTGSPTEVAIQCGFSAA